jgi:hypothetical protein
VKNKTLNDALARLRETTVVVLDDTIPDESGQASIVVRFSDGSVLHATYWRIFQDGKAQLSSFDHCQKYGLPAPINAKTRLAELLNGSVCREVQCDPETADLILRFSEAKKLQVFCFTGYEIWRISFPDGTGEYSNYARSNLL